MGSDLFIDKTIKVLLKMVWNAIVFWLFFEICRKISIMEVFVKEVTVFRVYSFLNKCFAKYVFLGNIWII